MREKRLTEKKIEVEIEGKKYVGKRIIQGTRTMSQTIYYKDFSMRVNE
jgi:uncharacterized protein (DUF433 family)